MYPLTKKIKEDLKHGEFVVLGDFAENHKFVIQDEVQSHYWNKKSCTLHPVMIYYRSRQNNLIQSASIVYESDDLKHDYYFVYKVLEQVVSYIQANLETQVKKITYVSDGCPNQYKNVYHFQTVCHHDEVDFHVPCEWVFFATSHGKSPCDGLGGTTKRLTTRASLQRPIENQITSAKEMYEFCVSEIKGIVFTFIDKEEMNLLRQEGSFLSKRFDPRDLYYIPGTQSFHHYTPMSKVEMGVKMVSTDEKFEFFFNFKTGQYRDEEDGEVLNAAISVNGGEYVVCSYNHYYWFGVVLTVNDEEKDAVIRLMHPVLPSNMFYWPRRHDEPHIPLNKIMMEINPLNAATSSGRNYTVHPDDLQEIQNFH